MLRIGLTGGIGGGKSTVAKIFEILGVPVYYADVAAKKLMLENNELVEKLRGYFGEQAYTIDGNLNREYLADIIFKNEKALTQMNKIVHPYVFDDYDKWHLQKRNVPYTIKEAALIFETNHHINLNKVIEVYAPLSIRIQRVLLRDNLLKSEIENRISRQLPEEKKLHLADYIIYNDGSYALIQQVVNIHRQLLIKKATNSK